MRPLGNDSQKSRIRSATGAYAAGSKPRSDFAMSPPAVSAEAREYTRRNTEDKEAGRGRERAFNVGAGAISLCGLRTAARAVPLYRGGIHLYDKVNAHPELGRRADCADARRRVVLG